MHSSDQFTFFVTVLWWLNCTTFYHIVPYILYCCIFGSDWDQFKVTNQRMKSEWIWIEHYFQYFLYHKSNQTTFWIFSATPPHTNLQSTFPFSPLAYFHFKGTFHDQQPPQLPPSTHIWMFTSDTTRHKKSIFCLPTLYTNIFLSKFIIVILFPNLANLATEYKHPQPH